MNLLDEICRHRRRVIRETRQRISYSDLEESRWWDHERSDFAAALQRKGADPIRFIAEIKRASPSAGWIRADADPISVARQSREGGASAISIITEPDYFHGDPKFLETVRGEITLPLLMKDFIVDEWQVAWARSLGADAILLIVACLDPVLFRDLLQAGRELGLTCLVEVHSEVELERALKGEVRLIGVNHRDLQTFTIDPSLGERLLPQIPAGIVRVAESGIRHRRDVERPDALGFDALLVGEALMRAESPGAALRVLRGDADQDQ
jgi:indole-3-glycerol phosphate synthase